MKREVLKFSTRTRECLANSSISKIVAMQNKFKSTFEIRNSNKILHVTCLTSSTKETLKIIVKY